MTKDEILTELRVLNEAEGAIRNRRTELKHELVMLGKWRPGDVIQTPKGTFKIGKVNISEFDGRAWGYQGHKRKKNGGWHENHQRLFNQDQWVLIDRPEGLT